MGLMMSPEWVHLGWSPCGLANKTDVMIFRKQFVVDPKGALNKDAVDEKPIKIFYREI